MPFVRTSVAGERINLYGGAGAGKSHSAWSIAQRLQKTNSPAQLFLLDCDNGYYDNAEEFPDVENIVHLPFDADEWEEFSTVVDKAIANADPRRGDWFIVDRIDPTWESIQQHYCLDPTTRVLTSDLRWVAAGSVRHGDLLLGFEEFAKKKGESSSPKVTRDWEVASVIEPHFRQLPCYELVFEDGTTIVASEQHKWLVASTGEGSKKVDGGLGRFHWITTERIRPQHGKRPGSKVVKPIQPWTEAQMNTWEAGYLSAAFEGEGYLTLSLPAHGNGAKMSLGFSQNPNVMLDQVKKCLSNAEIRFSEHKQSKETDVRSLLVGHRADQLRLLGMVRPERLLEKFDPTRLGSMRTNKTVRLMEKRFVGLREVVAFETTSKTFIAEGFASHNSRTVKGVDIDDWRVDVMAKKAKGGAKSTRGGLEGEEWAIVKRKFRKPYTKMITSNCNVLLISGEKKVGKANDDFSMTSKEDQDTFGSVGFMPAGQKDLPHMCRDIIRLRAANLRTGDFRATAAKARGREMKFDNTPVKDFSLDFLLKVAKWKMAAK